MSGLVMKYFVLKPKGNDIYAQASRKAMRNYAEMIAQDNPTLSKELNEWADREMAEAIGETPDDIIFYMGPHRSSSKLATYAVDTTEKLLTAEARVLELEAERAEQLSILTSVGPITCRNGKQHEHYDGCVYCRIEELEDALEELIFASECLVSHAYINDARAALQPKGE